MQSKTGPILRIIAEALEKIAGVFDGKPAALDPCKCVGSAEVEKLATAAAHEETVRQAVAAELPDREDATPPAVPPGAFDTFSKGALDRVAESAGVDPAAAFAPPATATGGPELDSDGLPWDSRIHSETKNQNKDGTWRVKRNTDPALVEQVKAELRAALSAPVPPAPPAEAPPAVPPAPPSDDLPPVSFAGFVQAVTKKQAAGLLTVQEVNEVCAKHGLAQMPLLVNRLDLIPAIYEELRKIWTTRG